ncbi:SIS domain-containing protein [Aerococcus sanguinicola]|nr:MULTISPECIES: SIS domain-containing protein [Aerococcus]
MRHYIYQEKEINLNLLNNKHLLDAIQGLTLSACKGIVIYATGSSANAVNAAKPFMAKILGLPVFVSEPSLALSYDNQWQDDFLYIAVSQGGHSASVIQLVEQLQKENHQVWTLTSDLESPLAESARNLLHLAMPVEEMPYVTAGYTATILYLYLFALKASCEANLISEESYFSYLNELKTVVNQADSVIKLSETWIKKNFNAFKKAQRFVFIGYGATYGVAKEAETKFTETLHLPAHGHELEEYMHGPYLGLNPNDILVLIDSNGLLSERMKRLRIFLDKHMEDTYQVSISQDEERGNDLMLDLDCNEYFAPLLLTIPFHLLSYEVSQVKGFDLTVSFYPDFDEITQSKV